MPDKNTSSSDVLTQAIRIRDPQYREIYTNSSINGLGPFDIYIIFQKTTEIAPSQIGIVDLMSFSMSPQHFKAFVVALNETLVAYENSFGRLTISKDETTPTRSAAQIEALIAEQKAKRAAAISSNEPPPPSKRSRASSRKKGPPP